MAANILERSNDRLRQRRQMQCMKTKFISQSSPVCCRVARALGSESRFSNSRVPTGLFVCRAGVLIALCAFAPAVSLQAQGLAHRPNKLPDIVQIVTPVSSGSWTVTGSLNAARFQHTATLLLNGMVLVAGGGNGTPNTLASAELYDPTTAIWTDTGSLDN